MLSSLWHSPPRPDDEVGPEFLPEDKYFILRSRFVQASWHRGLVGLAIGYVVGRALKTRGFPMIGAGMGIGYTIAQYRPFFASEHH